MTIYDIAKLAGVSASSVSRVINNKPGVGKETREKILALLDQYHYSLDETARGLSKKSSKTIGVLISVMESVVLVRSSQARSMRICCRYSTTPEPVAFLKRLER